MTIAGSIGILIVIALILAIGIPLGGYMYRVFSGKKSWFDPVCAPVEGVLYRAVGVDPSVQMDWKAYLRALMLVNFIMMIFVYLLFRLQGVLPLNPDHIKGMPWDLAFNTAASFITNTNWQNYAGEQSLSFLLSQSGIFKVRGVATWILAFVYIVGLIHRCQSVNSLTSFFNEDSLLQRMTGIQRVTQSALSRFLTGFSQWDMFNQKRTARLQEDLDTALADGDVLALDDTHAPHPYAKGIPFLYWLFDSSSKVYTWAMNIVALHAVRSNGFEYPWSYAIWTKPENDADKKQSKLDLAWHMLQTVRKQVRCRLWVVMDRWYFSKTFLLQCESENFDWVTKAKRNAQLFRRMIEPGTGRERFVPIRPKDLIREAYPMLMTQKGVDVASVACENIYVKMPKPSLNRRGKPCTKMKYTRVAAVVGKRMKSKATRLLLNQRN